VSVLADDSVSQPGGAGVAHYIRRVIERRGILPTPPRRAVTIGSNAAGTAVTLPGSGCNLVISGDPRSGKSWIAGLLVERLIQEGYRVCIVDPEGDYAKMAQRCKIITFGHELALPSPQAAARLLSNEPLSVVFTLSTLPPSEQINYVNQLMAALEDIRDATGIPHWLVIDEAHYFFGPQSPCLKYLNSTTGSVGLVTYRPSLLASEAYNTVGAHIFTSTNVEEERYFVTKVLQAHPGIGVAAHTALEALEPPQAGLLMANLSSGAWQVFVPGERFTNHAHHARKYADTRLPENKAFRFLNGSHLLTAHNMNEFYQAIQTIPLSSLRHHLGVGDFSRWVSEVMGDQQLARGLRKLERAIPAGAAPDRAEILAHIQDHYLIQEEN
jgi:Helicase HerA, central domain